MRDCVQTRKRPFRVRLLAGLIGGFAATIAMSRFQSAWNMATRRMARSNKGSHAFARSPDIQPTDVETTRILVNRIATLGGFEFSDPAATKTALALHFAIGAGGGCAHCFLGNMAFPRFQKEHSLVAGAAFGAALFVIADLALLPLMGFPDEGSRSPLGTCFYGMSSHVVYGMAAAKTCNFVLEFL